MQNPLGIVYTRTAAYYAKLKDRFLRKIKRGDFNSLSLRKKHQTLFRLRKTEKRLLSLEAKLGITAGVALVTLSGQQANAQVFGPFEQNDERNPIPPLTRMYGPRPVAVDIDADGDLDFFIGTWDGGILFFQNYSGPGPVTDLRNNFEENPLSDAWVSYAASPTFGDVDDDGDYDLLVGNYYGYTFFFRNIGTPTNPEFVQETGASNPFDGIRTAYVQYGYAAPTLVDFDGDGDVDMFLGSDYFETAKVFRYFENQDGEFVEQPGNPLQFGGSDSFYIDYGIAAFTDLDGDGDLDAAIGSDHYPYGLFIFMNRDVENGPDDPEFERLPSDLAFLEIFRGGPEFVDMDGDGHMDLIVGQAEGAGTQILYFKNDGNNNFEQVEDFRLNPFVDGFDFQEKATVTFVDVDNDGDQDAVMGNKYDLSPDDPPIFIFENVDGAFLPTTSERLNNQWKGSPTLVDIDGDTDLDIFVGASYEIFFYRQDGVGSGTYTRGYSTDLGLGAVTHGIQFFNFDKTEDNDLDAIGFSDGSNNLLFLKNIGTVTEPEFEFIPSPAPFDTFEFNDRPLARIVDINHDGLTDILLTENSPYQEILEFNLFLGKTDGTWEPSPIPLAFSPFETDSFVDFVDLDGDGDLDALWGIGNYRIEIQVEDFEFTGLDGTFRYFENINPAPEVTLTVESIELMPQSAPAILDASLTLGDADLDIINRAVISIADYQPDEEQLSFTPQGPITGTFDEDYGVLTLTGPGTIAEFEAALRTVTYEYTGSLASSGGRKGTSAGKTSTIAREISFAVFDIDNTTPDARVMTVNVAFANLPPSVTGSGSTPVFTPGGDPVAIDNGVVLSDGDDAYLEGATILITPSSFVAEQDQLLFTNVGELSGSYDAATGVLTVTGGPRSIADYQAFIRNIEYSNSSSTPDLQNRTIEITVTDGEDASNTLSIEVQVVATNSPPVVITGPGPVQFTAQGPAVVIDPTLMVTDNDDVDLTGASVIISSGTFVSAEDQLEFTDQNGISGTFDVATGVLTLTGTSSVANYQAALRSVRYYNSSTTPNTQDRSFMFSVTDGTNNSAPATKIITIILNAPPVITPEILKTTIQGFETVDLNDLISDPNGNLDLTSFTITVQPLSGAEATIDGDNNLRIDYDGVNFVGTDWLTIQACDDLGSCTSAEITIEVVGDIEVYNALSPNGDNKNDMLRLEYIDILYPENHVYIYGRWGDLVFDVANYDNQTRVFRGLNNSGNKLPAGTYFYKIVVPGTSKPVSGYLVLKL